MIVTDVTVLEKSLVVEKTPADDVEVRSIVVSDSTFLSPMASRDCTVITLEAAPAVIVWAELEKFSRSTFRTTVSVTPVVVSVMVPMVLPSASLITSFGAPNPDVVELENMDVTTLDAPEPFALNFPPQSFPPPVGGANHSTGMLNSNP